MVKDHRTDLNEFKKEAKAGKSPEVKDAAEQGEKVIASHLRMIEQIAQKHNVTMAQGSQ
jgi:putative membrane protein